MKRKIIFYLLLFLLFSYKLLPVTGIEKLKKKVEEIGGLKFKSDVGIKYLTKKDFEHYLSKIFSKEYPEKLSDQESLYLMLMGFEDRRLDIRNIRYRAIINNIGGLYNEKTNELYALESYKDFNFINANIIVHELRHSIQDQYFNLNKLLNELSDFDDRKLAVLAAIEGDATLVMAEFSGLDPKLLTSSYNADVLMSFTPHSNRAHLYSAPPVIKHQLIMPYFSGLHFVNFIKTKKKWKGVNKILLAPPKSTEQIMHPEKYLKKERPVSVSVNYRPKNFKLFHSGVVGEYFLNVLLKAELNNMNAAQGWGGDFFRIYLDSDQYFLIWKSIWDKQKQCSRFFQNYKKFLEHKYNITFKKGQTFLAGRTKAGYFFLYRFLKKILFVRTNNRNEINKFISGGHYD